MWSAGERECETTPPRRAKSRETVPRAADAVDLGEIAREKLAGRRGAPGNERAVRERRAEIRREDARRDPGLAHAERREAPAGVRRLKLEEAAGVAGIVRRRDDLHEARGGREHPGDDAVEVGGDAFGVMEGERSS